MKILSKQNLFLFALLLCIACGQDSVSNAETVVDGNPVAEQEGHLAKNNYRYGIKSGIVTYKMVVMGMPTEIVTYFDQYGDVEATISKVVAKVMGMSVETESKTITKDGYVYSIDMEEKTGTKVKLSDDFDYRSFDLRKLDGEMKQQFENALAHAKTETFLGKTCKVIEMKDGNVGTDSKIWLWKNIPLRYSINSAQGKIEMQASSVEEKAVDSHFFEVPSDISFREVGPDDLEKQLDMLKQMQGEQ